MNTAQPIPDSNTKELTPITGVTEDRAAALLGSGISPLVVANSLGISPSRISQLLSDENFSARVAELRYKNLAKHNERDGVADGIEDAILEKLEESLPLVHRPMELVKMYQIVNAAKRRGTGTPEAMVEKQSIIQLVVPIQILNKFQTNQQGQVVTVGSQDLLTIQSGALDNLVKSREKEGIENGSPIVGTRAISIESL